MKFKNLIYHLFVFFIACQPQKSEEVRRWEAQAEQITIIRDDFGVPHIYGKTDADAVFGMLFAQAEDDFRRIERNYVWATGRLAELEGEDAIYSDLRANMYMTEAEAKATYESAPDWLKALSQAFADGLNYYLYTHPEVTPNVITRYEPWMPMFFSEGSIGGDIERISTQRIKAFYEEDKSLGLSEYNDGLLHPDPYTEPKGSNGFAIAPELSATGNALLLINPHTSFYFRPEVHVVSEEGLNAYGAVTWGQFFVYQGFNEKTGWMHTSTYVDFIDEFVEDIVETDSTLQYRYGDELRDVEVHTVTLKYKNGDTNGEREFEFYRTHHGPITHKLDDKWVATKINWDPVNALIQSFTRTKLNNYDEFREMMDIRTNSSNNTVFADAEGNIAYFHGNFIPKRNPGIDPSKPLDGSDPETDWIEIHTVDESIVVANPATGWIQNTNSTPFMAAGEFSPKQADYPLYMAPDQENYRALHAVRVLKDARDITLDGLIELAYDPYLPAFETLVPMLTAAYERAGGNHPDLREAVDTLRKWDYRTSMESVAMSVAHYYGSEYARDFGSPDRLIPFNQNNLGIQVRLPENAELVETFARALGKLNEDFGSWKTPWGEINRFQRLSGDIDLQFDDEKESLPIGMASGRWGALASYGATARPNTKRIYGSSGNSFVAVVEFGERIRAKSILAGGQNADQSSPHFYDQAQRYADADFKDVAYYREDVEARAKETYSPGKRK
jgi:acyl-homoserine lactone acylase PvdQ